MKKFLGFLLAVVMCLTCVVVPAKPAYAAKAMNLSEDSMTLTVGKSKTLVMYVGGGKYTKVTWSSSNKKVATVSKKGVVKAVAAGKAIITAKTDFGKVTCKVTVKSAAPAAVKNVKVQTGTYYSYWNKHRAELNKKGYNQGDVYDAIISWDAAARAQGYSVKIYWLEEGQPLTSTVDVKKDGKQFVFSTKGAHYGTGLIAKDEKSFITKGSKKKFTSSKLSFQVTGNGSTIWITKVQIKSYRVVSGKKVYGKAVTKKVSLN